MQKTIRFRSVWFKNIFVTFMIESENGGYCREEIVHDTSIFRCDTFDKVASCDKASAIASRWERCGALCME